MDDFIVMADGYSNHGNHHHNDGAAPSSVITATTTTMARTRTAAVRLQLPHKFGDCFCKQSLDRRSTWNFFENHVSSGAPIYCFSNHLLVLEAIIG